MVRRKIVKSRGRVDRSVLTYRTKDITGQVFGRLTVLGPTGEKAKDGSLRWLCQCSCGNTHVTVSGNLRNGNVRSCRCLQKEVARAKAIANPASLKHGKVGTPAYKSWTVMRRRCFDKKFKDYPLYGGRGISIAEEWSDFSTFLKDMGERPEGMSLDRKDPNGNYCKDNCRWATRRVQGNNTRRNHLLMYKGETLTLAQWARRLDMSYTLLRARINMLGWSVEKAIETEVNSNVKDY